MPDTYIRFSDLKDSHPSPIDGANDLLAIAHKDTQSPTGYNSMSVTPNALGAHSIEDQTFVNLHTTQKTVEGAINEIADNAPPHTYSTTEQVVGTWIDGSTVYEKVCTGTTNTSTSQVLASGVGKIISVSGHAGTYALPAVQLDSDRQYIIVLLGEATHEAKLFTLGSNYNGLTYEVVLRYIKVSS